VLVVAILFACGLLIGLGTKIVLGQGIAWGIPTTVGLIGGILLFGRLQARRTAQAEPAPAASVIPSPVAADATA
jgi:hypothetical protein